MLNNNRIKEAETNIRSYMRDGLLRKVSPIDKNILNILNNNSEESLKVANMLYEQNTSSLWTIVCSYYSMYYAANAVLYKKGYKIGHSISHKITADALIVFVRNLLKEQFIDDFEFAKEEALQIGGLKADELVESFDFERMKRSRFQYSMTETAKYSKARTSLERAKIFALEMEKLLE